MRIISNCLRQVKQMSEATVSIHHEPPGGCMITAGHLLVKAAIYKVILSKHAFYTFMNDKCRDQSQATFPVFWGDENSRATSCHSTPSTSSSIIIGGVENTRLAFVPPNPKELVRTAMGPRFRARGLGPTSASPSTSPGSALVRFRVGGAMCSAKARTVNMASTAPAQNPKVSHAEYIPGLTSPDCTCLTTRTFVYNLHHAAGVEKKGSSGFA